MRTLTTLLGMLAAGLAATTLYLSMELNAARDELARTRPHAIVPDALPPAPSIPERGGAHPVAVANPAPPPKAVSDDVAMAREWGALARDPAVRETVRQDLIRSFRKRFPSLARHLGLSIDEYSRLANLLADQKLRLGDARYECSQKPGCDDLTVMRTFIPEHDREVAQLLGERKQQFDDYQDNTGERFTVQYFRGDLPDSIALGQQQAERLIAVLGEERRLAIRDMQQRGGNPGVTTSSRGVLLYSTLATGSARVAEAEEFQRRQRQRAATVLTSAQLDAYARMQSDLLEEMRLRWEMEERPDPRP